MQTAEAFRVALFLAMVLAVYIGAAGILLGFFLRRPASGAPPGPARRLARRAILAAALLGLLCMAYGHWIEPYWPQVTHVRLASRKIPQGTRPIRVVQISDLHSDPKPRLEERLPDLIAAEKPDLIVFTGDSINCASGLPVLRRCLTRLAAIAPTFAVKGNWDVWNWTDLERFAGTGVSELNGQSATVTVAGVPVVITGLSVDNRRPIETILDGTTSGAFTIFLHHYPDFLDEAARGGIDLYCAGHTHGGQVALPFYGALITLAKFGKKYEQGLYREGNTWMYVNRGIGMEGGAAPRVRFCARPEVTVFEIGPAS